MSRLEFHIAGLLASFVLFHSLTSLCDSAAVKQTTSEPNEIYYGAENDDGPIYYPDITQHNDDILLAHETRFQAFQKNKDSEFEHELLAESVKQEAGFESVLSLETPLPDWYVQLRFDNFKKLNGYVYSNGEEETGAFDNYRENLNRVYAHNRRYIAGFEANFQSADYPWAAMSREQFSRNYLGLNLTAELEHIQQNPAKHLNKNMYDTVQVAVEKDWRATPCLNSVKNQGTCGCCFIFSAAAVMEARGCIKNGMKTLPDISEQKYLDCPDSNKYRNNGCNGGTVGGVYAYVKDSGRSDPLNTYPYEERKRPSCKTPVSPLVRVIDHKSFIGYNEDLLIKILGLDGPVTIGICVDHAFQSFRTANPREVYYNRAGSCIDHHAVAVFGYTKDALIIKNSWGTEYWGYKGYMLMGRGSTAASYILEFGYPEMGNK